jgi:uncharacterized protein (DUF488 family)
MEKALFSIGHGSRKAEELLELLQKFQIGFLADVRTYPVSRFHPQFNRDRLKQFLEAYGIRYVFMGDALGGRPKDPSCYDDGKVNYYKLKNTGYFKAGIARLQKAAENNIPLAVMCSERNPAVCHRALLIGEVLKHGAIEMYHINEKGELVQQSELFPENQASKS